MNKPDRRRDHAAREDWNNCLQEHLPLAPDRRRDHITRLAIDQISNGKRWDLVMDGTVDISIGEGGGITYSPRVEWGATLPGMDQS